MDENLSSPQPWWQRLSRWILRLIGWELDDNLPPGQKFLVIGAFHTSNWDFPLVLLGMGGLGLRPRWVGKDSLFRGLPGRLMKLMGGIPVVRGARRNFVQQIVDLYNASERLVITLAPEGTRSKTTHWKSGFYYIARGAGIPIALGYLDYATRRVGIGGWFVPSGDLQADMDVIRAFYRDKRGRYPDNHGEVRLLSEMEAQ